MSGVSENYRELNIDEVDAVAIECASAWKDISIPKAQYELCVRRELEYLTEGFPCAPFKALTNCLFNIPFGELIDHKPTLLDIGASSGYYRSVLELSGFNFDYFGLDFSPAFRDMALSLYPDIHFDVGDARSLPYANNNFDVVLHSACLMHIADYNTAIKEAVRVASRYVVFHRTPTISGPTRYWRKEAYGVPCLEIHFNQGDLLQIFQANNLSVLHTENVFQDQDGFSHRTFLCRKNGAPEPYASQKSV